MAEKKGKILYIQTSGLDTPERLYAPLLLAQTARAMGIEAGILFTIKGVEIVKKGGAEKIKIGELPTLSEVLKRTQERGVQFYVCDQSNAILGTERGGYIDGVKIIGAAATNNMALESDSVITF
ncbi:MAG: DsrE/DsrF/DrsH-like family protein [Candidatus Thermoplasmatota archaeon]|nr:DsrE/DsrF/DrsH-like family protein [Candidatus Thermoplasmatota archaeon]